MSITIDSLVTNLNTYFGDKTEDRVSNEERFQAITEATAWLLEELGNEHMVDGIEIDAYDTVNTYRVTGILPDLLTGADLRREEMDHTLPFQRKAPREILSNIANNSKEHAWATERIDDETYLYIVFPHKHSHLVVDYLNTDGNWLADTTGSDAVNLTDNNYEFKFGSGSLQFDVDVSQTVNNKATIYTSGINSTDLTRYKDSGGFLFEIYIPDASEVSSINLFWGSDNTADPSTKANYFSETVTSDINGDDFINGWNTVLVDWRDATEVGSPDVTDIGYYEMVLNYTGSQTDMTVRVDFLRLAKPEKLSFNFISWNVGQVSTGDPTKITAFTATTNVPFFSDRYNQYRYPVAHKAASILFYSVRLLEEAQMEESAAIRSLQRYQKNFESQQVKEYRTFKVAGVNLRRKRRPKKR